MVAVCIEFHPVINCHVLDLSKCPQSECPFFQEEDDDVEDFEAEQLCTFQNGCRATAIAWSPETSITSLPKVLR